MTIRPAEVRDLPAVLTLAVDLLDFLKSQNAQANISTDRDKLIGGALNYLVFKMSRQDHCVLVQTDGGKQVTHFCAGNINPLPEFCEYEVVGELTWIYPLNMFIRPLINAFDAWAQKQGATARWGFASPNNKSSQLLMQRDGMNLDILHYLKPYGDKL